MSSKDDQTALNSERKNARTFRLPMVKIKRGAKIRFIKDYKGTSINSDISGLPEAK